MNNSIRGRYKAEAVFDERRSTAGIEQKRQKDTSGKRGYVKPVHPCTGLTTRFAECKTGYCVEPPPSLAGFGFVMVIENKMQQSAIRDRRRNNY